MKTKSVESINQYTSVIQTMDDNIKAHGGNIKVETKEGERSEFVVQLPVAHVSRSEGCGSKFIIQSPIFKISGS